MKYYWIIFISANLIGFFIMWWDKQAAKNKLGRISEFNLFGIAVIGGGIGEYIAMHLFRHKTKHKRFVFGIPAIIILHAIALIAYKIYLD